MATEAFSGLYSTNDIWRGNDTTRCLTDDLDSIDDTIDSLPNTYASKNHVHTGYASANHTHDVSDIIPETLSISKGGTGASTASDALNNLGINDYVDDAIKNAIPNSHILWSGCYFMKASQAATLSEKVSDQKNGIILVFSLYQNGAAVMNNSNAFFVPKQLVGIYTTHVIGAVTFSSVATKSIMIRDDKLTGFDSNVQSGTSNGITFNNAGWVLTRVIGV